LSETVVTANRVRGQAVRQGSGRDVDQKTCFRVETLYANKQIRGPGGTKRLHCPESTEGLGTADGKKECWKIFQAVGGEEKIGR